MEKQLPYFIVPMADIFHSYILAFKKSILIKYLFKSNPVYPLKRSPLSHISREKTLFFSSSQISFRVRWEHNLWSKNQAHRSLPMRWIHLLNSYLWESALAHLVDRLRKRATNLPNITLEYLNFFTKFLSSQ